MNMNKDRHYKYNRYEELQGVVFLDTMIEMQTRFMKYGLKKD